MGRPGFSLLESLMALCLTLLILVACLEFFGLGRKVFFRLRDSEEERLAVLAALEKIRLDTSRAGAGLTVPIRLGLLAGLKVEVENGRLFLESAESILAPLQDLNAGETLLLCQGGQGLGAGRNVCIHDGGKGEIRSLEQTGMGFIIISEPLVHSYKKEEARVVAVGSTTYYLDSGVIRRKVNASSGQPLLEEVEAWEVRGEPGSRLLAVGLKLKGKERRHEITVCPKNMALALVADS
jgi:hypothetical protein